ncbi:MAG: hypothetical protein JOZ93_12740 [Sinobacteraceae bacterium]|nr:hypothetical protein [Nevskiaceae bacterium]MBV9913441.1 hypothetical protein [Nevskiaceae bacterium]
MSLFLGIDGGGSKTSFILLEESGRICARHREGSASYLELGLDGLQALLTRGVQSLMQQADARTDELSYAFLGIPCYGEDSSLIARLDALPRGVLPERSWTCGNDVVCGWAGALAGKDGINVVAGTGSIAYGEREGHCARAGGWGELFSDEGSAWWIVREGLAAFAKMSDGRIPRTDIYQRMRSHFALDADLDLCAAIHALCERGRSGFAALAPLITAAADAGDPAARGILHHAARELADLVCAVHARLPDPGVMPVLVSWSGSLFGVPQLLQAFHAELGSLPKFTLRAPRFPPDVGAALHAARLSGGALTDAAVAALEASSQGGSQSAAAATAAR